MIGERIKRARSAAGLSLRSVGELAGLSAMAISKFERGEATPTSQTLIRLSRALETPIEFFFRPDVVTLTKPEYRKRKSLGKKELARIEADILDQAERFIELLSIFPNPPINAFDIPRGLPNSINTLSEVEDIAVQMRKEWRLGLKGIAALADTFEEQGIMVIITQKSGDKFDGLAAQINGFPLVAVGADWPGDRQRFTLAHELGHLVLKGRLASGMDEEATCNRFAGAFLAPKDVVIEELGGYRRHIEPRELYQLKHEYGLSMSGWAYRAWQCGIISQSTHESLMKFFSTKGWRKNEPGEPFPTEKPHFFEQLVMRALAESMISTSKAAELMSVPLSQFRDRLRLDAANAPPN